MLGFTLNPQKKEVFLSLIVFLISFLVYLITLCPTVYVADSGELITSAYTLGIAHPPGYPLWCILGKIFSFLPVGNIAYRINLMSAFFASVNNLFVYLIVYRLIKNQAVAFVTSLLTSFGNTLWYSAVSAEVYTLNAAFVSITFFLLLIWYLKKREIYLYLLSLLLALSLANHHSMLLSGLVYVFFVFVFWKNKNIRTFITILIFFILGLSVYIYIPLRAKIEPIQNWGEVKTWSDFFIHVSRKQYGELSKNLRSLKLFTEQIVAYTKFCAKQYSLFLFLLIPFGIFKLYKQNKTFLLLILFTFLINSLGIILLLNFKVTAEELNLVNVFFIPSYIFLGIFSGLGIIFLYEKFPYLKIFLILFPIIPLIANFNQNNLSENYFGYEYAVSFLNCLDKDAILFSVRDSLSFTLLYVTTCEELRKDVTLYTTQLVLERVFPSAKLRINISENEKKQKILSFQQNIILTSGRPVYFELSPDIQDLPPGYTIRHDSLLYRVYSPHEIHEQSQKLIYKRKFEPKKLRNLDRYLRQAATDFYVRECLADYHFHLGLYYAEIGDWPNALTEFKKAGEIGYDIAVLHNNIGAIYYMIGKFEEAVAEYLKAIKIDPWAPQAYYNLGLYYRDIVKDINLANQYFEKFTLIQQGKL